VVTWEVDVISMSFGCSAAVPIIEHEIQNAASKGVVMFAAASNCGGNDLISWPACHDEVIPVYASRGDGNKYDRNPSPDPKSENFSVVGTSLEGSWPSQIPGARTTQHRSGTSGATPIAAGIAATILQLMRAEKSEFLQRRSPLRQDVESKYYERCITSLRTSRGMKAAFALMSPRERDGYDYVTPWSLLDGADGDNWDIVYKICEVQGKLLDQKRKGKRVRV
jgi:subtilisin family serine protease